VKYGGILIYRSNASSIPKSVPTFRSGYGPGPAISRRTSGRGNHCQPSLAAGLWLLCMIGFVLSKLGTLLQMMVVNPRLFFAGKAYEWTAEELEHTEGCHFDGSMIRIERLEYHIPVELNKTASRTMVVVHPLKKAVNGRVAQTVEEKTKEKNVKKKRTSSEDSSSSDDEEHKKVVLEKKIENKTQKESSKKEESISSEEEESQEEQEKEGETKKSASVGVKSESVADAEKDKNDSSKDSGSEESDSDDVKAT
ncbi:hypothetical protein Tco_1281023, partial [Tanacetum coccineum]